MEVSTTLAVGLGVRKVRFRGVNVTLSLDGAAVGADWADREPTAGMTVRVCWRSPARKHTERSKPTWQR